MNREFIHGDVEKFRRRRLVPADPIENEPHVPPHRLAQAEFLTCGDSRFQYEMIGPDHGAPRWR